MSSRIDDNYAKLLQSLHEIAQQTNALTEPLRPISEALDSLKKPLAEFSETTQISNTLADGFKTFSTLKVPTVDIQTSIGPLIDTFQQTLKAVDTSTITQNLTAGLDILIRTYDLNKMGLCSREIAELVDAGKLERIKQGYYTIPEFSETHSDARLISQLYPDGILTLTTALFFYGYSDRTPLTWDIAIDRDVSKARFNIDYPYVKPYYMEKKHLEYGVTTAKYEDCTLAMFDRDRLICECIKHESKLEKETYNKAITSYINDSKKSVTNLLEYAKRRNIHKKVRDRIEVWL